MYIIYNVSEIVGHAESVDIKLNHRVRAFPLRVWRYSHFVNTILIG